VAPAASTVPPAAPTDFDPEVAAVVPSVVLLEHAESVIDVRERKSVLIMSDRRNMSLPNRGKTSVEPLEAFTSPKVAANSRANFRECV